MYLKLIPFFFFVAILNAQNLSFTYSSEANYQDSSNPNVTNTKTYNDLLNLFKKTQNNEGDFKLFSIDLFGFLPSFTPYTESAWNDKVTNFLYSVTTSKDENGNIIYDSIFSHKSYSDLYFGLNYNYSFNLSEQTEKSEFLYITVYRKDSVTSIFNPSNVTTNYSPIFLLIPSNKVTSLMIQDTTYNILVLAEPFQIDQKQFSNSDLNFNVAVNLFESTEIEVNNYKTLMNLNLFEVMNQHQDLPLFVEDTEQNKVSIKDALKVIDTVNVYQEGKYQKMIDTITLGTFELNPVLEINLKTPLQDNTIRFNGFEAGISPATRRKFLFLSESRK